MVKIGNEEIPIWVYGDKKNPPIFYIHGMSRAFSENDGDLPVRYLMKNYAVVAFDLPGWGKSKGLNISPMDLIEEISNALGIKKFFLFGTSYGGIVSMLYAIEHPSSIVGVIIAGVPRVSSSILLFIISSYKIGPKRMHQGVKGFVEFQKNLSKITVPALLLYSKSDRTSPVSSGEYYKRKMSNSKLVVIDGRSHGWLLHRIIDNNFYESINTFLKSLSV